MELSQILFALVIPVEIGLLFLFYKFYFAEYNANKWLEKAQQEGFLVELLDPVIETICLDVSETMMERIKNEILSQQGTITRANMNPENESEIGLAMAQKVLETAGLKKVSPILALRVAQGLKKIVKKPEQADEYETGENLLNSPIL